MLYQPDYCYALYSYFALVLPDFQVIFQGFQKNLPTWLNLKIQIWKKKPTMVTEIFRFLKVILTFGQVPTPAFLISLSLLVSSRMTWHALQAYICSHRQSRQEILK